MKHDAYPTLVFAGPNEFEQFLKENHDKVPGIWLKMAKKVSGIKSITYDEALEVALCYGWIDGLVNRFDEDYYIQKFTPRGPRSIWSQRNIRISGELIKAKRMKAAGLLAIEGAKKDGRWENAYSGAKSFVIPEDFLKEVKKDKKTFEFFKTLNRTNLYAIYYRLQTAKKQETRENRMKIILEKLKEGKKLI